MSSIIGVIVVVIVIVLAIIVGPSLVGSLVERVRGPKNYRDRYGLGPVNPNETFEQVIAEAAWVKHVDETGALNGMSRDERWRAHDQWARSHS